jgi:hypothetical protein
MEVEKEEIEFWLAVNDEGTVPFPSGLAPLMLLVGPVAGAGRVLVRMVDFGRTPDASKRSERAVRESVQ